MARLLVFDRDNTHPDPTMDREGCYKTGDVVRIEPDGHVFSPRAQQYPFRIVDLPGAPEDYRHLMDGEPRTMRDDFPRAMMPMRRMHKAMRAAMRTNTRRLKGWSVAPDGAITRKLSGV